MAIVRFASLLALLAVVAGCGKDKFSITSPTGLNQSEATAPQGPPRLTLYIDRSGADTWNLRAGGEPKVGLDRQPHPDATLHDMTVVSWACGQRQEYAATIYNSRWEFNSNTTLRQNIRACNGNVRFSIRFTAKYQASASAAPVYTEHWQEFNPRPAVLSLNGVGPAVTFERGDDGRWVVSTRLQ